jgi:uncharacterized SAM-dependent methyltransferase
MSALSVAEVAPGGVAMRFRTTVLREDSADTTVEELRRDVLHGLTKPLGSKSIPSKYFYDDAGSGK